MWSHYADSHTGFVVGFDEESLVAWERRISGADPDARFHERVTGLQVRGVEMNHEKEMPALVPCEMRAVEIVTAIVTHKSIDWDYEDEWRLIMMKFDESSLLDLSNEDRAQVLPDSVITEVTLGERASDQNVDLMKVLLRCREDKVKLYRARLSDHEFELVRDEIDY